MAYPLEKMRHGDVLGFFHDSGAMGARLCFARVVRVGKARVTVEYENGRRASVLPNHFHGKASIDEYGDVCPHWAPRQPAYSGTDRLQDRA